MLQQKGKNHETKIISLTKDNNVLKVKKNSKLAKSLIGNGLVEEKVNKRK